MAKANRLIIFALFIFFSFVFRSSAETFVSGPIPTGSTWTLAGSPYIIDGLAIVTNGDTLNIDSGVTVKFNSNSELIVNGNLLAAGAPGNKIYFISNSLSSAPGNWLDIVFNPGSSWFL